MKGHEYLFTARDLVRHTILPLLVCGAFLGVIVLGTLARLLPVPKPTLDVDRSIVLHQAEASRTSSHAEILLIGDSSCLMDINARQLEQLTGQRVINLATLSYVDFSTHQLLLRNYLSANQPRNQFSVKTIVLLMHPESLRLFQRDDYYWNLIRDTMKTRAYYSRPTELARGVSPALVFKSRILTRLLPMPLAGKYGQHYGFNQNLWNHLTENNGSALDPHQYPSIPPAGNPEYRLAPQLESAANEFRSTLPLRIRLVVGITPSPADFALRNHSENCRAMLSSWSQWLSADTTLTNLPFTLPPSHFATPTHLNSHGVTHYTHLLASALTNHSSFGTDLPPP